MLRSVSGRWNIAVRQGLGVRPPGLQTSNTSVTAGCSCSLRTRGRHRFFEDERKFIRNVREHPIKFGGYSVRSRSGHPHVRIEQNRYSELRAFLSDLAIHRSMEWLEEQFRRLPFEPYAPKRNRCPTSGVDSLV